MKKTIASALSLLVPVLSIAACAVPTGEPTKEESVSATSSALTGGPWTWKNTATLRCLDSGWGGYIGVSNVYTLDCNGGDYQEWTHTPGPYGDVITDKATGYCLDSNTSGDAYAITCNGGAFQQWTVTYKGAYGWEIKNVATQRCLDSNAKGDVYTLACNGGNFQRWF